MQLLFCPNMFQSHVISFTRNTKFGLTFFFSSSSSFPLPTAKKRKHDHDQREELVFFDIMCVVFCFCFCFCLFFCFFLTFFHHTKRQSYSARAQKDKHKCKKTFSNVGKTETQVQNKNEKRGEKFC